MGCAERNGWSALAVGAVLAAHAAACAVAACLFLGAAGCGGGFEAGGSRAGTPTSPAVAMDPADESLESNIETAGFKRRILARPLDEADPMEWTFNVLGVPADERLSYTFLWRLGDGTVLEGDIVRHIYTTPGLRDVLVCVTDPDGAMAYSLSCTIDVAASPDAVPDQLTVFIEYEVEPAGDQSLVYASATTSTLAAGETVAYVWAFGDGTSATGAEVAHRFAQSTDPYELSVSATTSLGRVGICLRQLRLPTDGGDGMEDDDPDLGPPPDDDGDDDEYEGPAVAGCTLQTQDVRLVLDGDAGHVLEFVHIPSGRILGPAGGPFVRWMLDGFAEPNGAEAHPATLVSRVRSSGERVLTFDFQGSGQVILEVREMPRFLDFRVVGVTGDLGDVRVMQLPHDVASIPTGQTMHFTRLGDGLMLALVPGTDETRIERTRSSWRVYSLKSLVGPGYGRNQAFGLFVCANAEFAGRMRQVEQYYDLPVGMNAKLDVAGDMDYLFLYPESDGTIDAGAVIQACHRLGFQSVLLVFGSWCEWSNPSEPFKARDGVAGVIRQLRAEGLLVGCHTFIHKLHRDGYYPATYPEKVLDESPPGEPDFVKTYDLRTDLPEIVAQQFASRFNQLGFDWVYFDGAEDAGDPIYGWGPETDWYAVPRAIGAALNSMNPAPRVVQSSYSRGKMWHYISRWGQRDYLGIDSQIERLDEIVARIPMCRENLYYPDLGWFNTRVLKPDGVTYRWATVEEVKYLCAVSVQHDAPIGLRTRLQDLNSHPQSDEIIGLIGTAVAKRRSR
ncbi:MAG: PKD domain-containing protein [Phycisphaerae bacterium]|nr:PKD domain-containing protein [Phycisphaerae bacterium]